MGSGSVAVCEVIANFAQWSADRRFSALRSLVPEDDDGPLLASFLLAVAADVSEDDLVRIEAVRVFEILQIDDDSLAERCRTALIHLARTDDDWDVRNAAGCAVFDLPGAERELRDDALHDRSGAGGLRARECRSRTGHVPPAP